MNNELTSAHTRQELGSAFLRECASYLGHVQGAGGMTGIARKYSESLHLSWFPSPKHGIPAYDSRYWSWEFYVARDGEYDLMIDVRPNGEVCFREGDGNGLYLELKLKYPFEMGEILELLEQITPENAEKTSFVSLPWSSIIQDLFLLAPGHKEQRVLKFSWPAWEKQFPELLAPLKVFYQGEFERLNAMEYSSWGDWLDRKATPESLPFAGELEEDDLLFSPSHGFHSARALLQSNEAFDDCEPRFVIRLKSQQSRMYFVDFLELTEEGEPILKALIKQAKELPQLLSQTKVEYPATRLQQIRLGVELRAARHAYEEKVQSLMRLREPAGKLHERYRLRSKNVQLLHTDYLSQIDADQNPLPFMIEWPLRRYERGDDPLLKIKYGQQLLNIILKFPLFLVLEELKSDAATKSLATPIESDLFSKPCSDGTLKKTLEDLQRQIADKGLKLRWFGPLLSSFVQDGGERAGKIITARNRFHHAPFDEDGMRKALESELPHLIKIFRNTLSGISFIMPESLKNQKGQLLVVSRSLMGYETDFPREEFTTTAPFTAFPDGHVVVVNDKRDAALPLSQFFKVQPIRQVSVDVGVFDRMVKGHPEFVFIRGLANEMP